MFLEVYGDGLMQGGDPVSIFTEERDEGMVVIVTDYSEYGTHALELLHRAGKAEPVMGRFTFAEALRVTLELLGGDEDIPVVWHGTGHTPACEVGGDFSHEEFKRAGLQAWWDENFTARLSSAKAWSSQGFTVAEAKLWRAHFCRPLGDGPQEAARWRDAGFGPEEAARWARNWNVGAAVARRAEGHSPRRQTVRGMRTR